MSEYFIKRDEKINGPFTIKQIMRGIKSKKLTVKDDISVSNDGPWERLHDFYNDSLNKQVAQTQVGSQAPRENQMRIVQQFELRKNTFGKYTAKYKCPYCKAGLVSGEQELREGEQCPECHRPFRFSVDAITQIESGRQQLREEKEQKDKEKKRGRQKKELARNKMSSARDKVSHVQKLNKTKRKEEKQKQRKEKQQARMANIYRDWGILILFVGGGLLIWAMLGMDTTVSTEFGQVHNIGLMAKQRNFMILGGVVMACGIGFILINEVRKK